MGYTFNAQEEQNQSAKNTGGYQ